MKIKLLSYFAAICLVFASCSRNKQIIEPPAVPHRAEPGIFDEYFWNYKWKKDSNKYVLQIETPNLTSNALTRGIEVYTALQSDWSLFQPVPSTLNDPYFPDTVNFSYTASPGILRVIAKSPFVINWEGDVQINYH